MADGVSSSPDGRDTPDKRQRNWTISLRNSPGTSFLKIVFRSKREIAAPDAPGLTPSEKIVAALSVPDYVR
jgi:hypothetical protein